VAELAPYGSSVLVGVVDSPVVVGPGGHARFTFRETEGGLLPCVAFEPTKTLPKIAARLLPGDRIRVWGGRAEDAALRLEGIEVLRTVARGGSGANPACPQCGHGMQSLGRGRGFRCPIDHHRLPPEARPRAKSGPPPERGCYHPTPSARRHLHPRAPESGRAGETTVRWWRRQPRTDL
jgi:tRNA(Ile2)-agmatinylcytidine synthase